MMVIKKAAERTARSPQGRRHGPARSRDARWGTLTPYLYVLPVLALMGTFIYWPLVYSVYLSMLDWNFVSPTREFVGMRNFVFLAQDQGFRQALVNTGLYLLVLVPLLVVLPLVLAMLLWPVRHSRAQGAYRAALFSPVVVSLAVISVVWLWILNPLGGLLNEFISLAGIGMGTDWLRNPDTAFWCVVAVSVWKMLGFNLILYIVALESVPRDYVEAARLDGAGSWALFRHVRFPLITPTFFFVLVVTFVFVSEEAFAVINVLTQGGPFGRTSNLFYYLYEKGFQFFEIGETSAVALIIFALVMSVTWLQFRFVEGRVHYE
jgi:multiple sugar transport system permease protein/sn-glycerol 3-phosphate transport system permease protein